MTTFTPRTWSARLPLGIGFAALLILVGVLGVWGVKARISGAVISSGMIEVENNRQVVQHPDGGVVGEILKKDGDLVAAGEVLLRLDHTLLSAELNIIEGQEFELLARQARLEAERDGLAELVISPDVKKAAMKHLELLDLIDGQARLLRARQDTQNREIEQISEQIAQAQNQIEGVDAQLEALAAQGHLLKQELIDSRSLLEKGLVQASHVSALSREEAALLGNVGRLKAAAAQLRGQIAAFGIQKLKLATQRREDAISTLRDLQFHGIELKQRRLALLEQLSKMEIRSPVSGVIYGSQVFALQSVVSPAQPLMYIIPQDQPLIVSSRIETIHIDQVHIGQDASLRFTAFDQRQTPVLLGKVSQLSADIFTDEITGLSYYQAELLPNAEELVKLGGQKLLPGMPVEVYIKTAERSPLEYLMKPFMDYFNKAFREP